MSNHNVELCFNLELHMWFRWWGRKTRCQSILSSCHIGTTGTAGNLFCAFPSPLNIHVVWNCISVTTGTNNVQCLDRWHRHREKITIRSESLCNWRFEVPVYQSSCVFQFFSKKHSFSIEFLWKKHFYHWIRSYHWIECHWLFKQIS